MTRDLDVWINGFLPGLLSGLLPALGLWLKSRRLKRKLARVSEDLRSFRFGEPRE